MGLSIDDMDVIACWGVRKLFDACNILEGKLSSSEVEQWISPFCVENDNLTETLLRRMAAFVDWVNVSQNGLADWFTTQP